MGKMTSELLTADEVIGQFFTRAATDMIVSIVGQYQRRRGHTGCGAAMKPRIRYGILDDFGEVVRWQWGKPSAHYKFITKRVQQVTPAIDWKSFEPALF